MGMAVHDGAEDPMVAYARALAAEAEAGLTAEEDAELEDRVRAGTAEVLVLDRLRACAWVTLRMAGGLSLAGQLSQVGADALLLQVPPGQAAAAGEWIVAVTALTEVVGLGAAAAPPRGTGSRLGLPSWTRAWARERSIVRLHRLHDAAVEGTIDRVGADHLDLAVHDPGLPRREANVRRYACVPFSAISGMHRR